jgi:hypothetical protein
MGYSFDLRRRSMLEIGDDLAALFGGGDLLGVLFEQDGIKVSLP